MSKLPPESRVRCPCCRGTGSDAGIVLLRGSDPDSGEVFTGCPLCHQQDYPCDAHKCLRCNGSGAVCPACRGDRFYRLDVDVTHPLFGRAIPCAICSPGGGSGVDPVRERAAITTYLTAQRAHTATQPRTDD